MYIERFDPYNPVVSGSAVVNYSTNGLNPYNSSASHVGLNVTIAGWTFEKNIYGAVLSPATGNIASITSNTFNQNAYGFGTNYGQAYQSIVLTSNTFSNQTRFPIYLGGTAYPTYSSNTFSGNQYNAIGLHGHFSVSGTWVAVNGGADTGGQPFPYVVFKTPPTTCRWARQPERCEH